MPEYEDYFLYYWKLFGADQPVVACKTLALVYEEIEAESENLLVHIISNRSFKFHTVAFRCRCWLRNLRAVYPTILATISCSIQSTMFTERNTSRF